MDLETKWFYPIGDDEKSSINSSPGTSTGKTLMCVISVSKNVLDTFSYSKPQTK